MKERRSTLKRYAAYDGNSVSLEISRVSGGKACHEKSLRKRVTSRFSVLVKEKQYQCAKYALPFQRDEQTNRSSAMMAQAVLHWYPLSEERTPKSGFLRLETKNNERRHR